MNAQSPGPNRRPTLRVKKKGGAPKGNRNALKHGAYTKEKLAERRALKEDVRSVLLRMQVAMAQANLLTMGKRPKVIVTKIEQLLD